MRCIAAAMRVGAAVLFAGVPHVQAAWSDGDAGIGNNGANITTFSMKTNTSVECYNACVANAACAAWQMHVASPACGPSASCTLKSNFGGYGFDTMEGAATPCYYDACVISGPVERAGQPLVQPVAFIQPSVGAVKPGGWLADELLVQGNGLSGYLNYFWADVKSSIWVGGSGDGYLHERGPYWLNGVVPLAVLLSNIGQNPANISEQVSAYVQYIVDHQQPDGWLGPDDTKSGDEYWARYNVLSSLIQWAEGSLASDPATAAALYRVVLLYVRQSTYRQLTSPYQINDWSAARAHDYLLSLHYCLDRFAQLRALGAVPDGITEATLYHAAYISHAQAIGNGAVWEAYFGGASFPNSTVTENFGMLTHGVNVAQAIKTGGVWWRQLPNASLVNSTYFRMAVLDRYHGAPSGVVQADEHLAGKMPSHGTELCGVVEALYSYETLGDILGDAAFFDRSELIAYNAYPATMTKDMWAHQYLQQANEANAILQDNHIWLTDGPAAIIYGLQPNFGCCTANMHQAWPKLAARLHKTTPDGGVAVTMWAPATTQLTLAGTGAAATVAVVTDYPFGDSANVTVTAPAGTPIRLRVPGWADAATLCASASGKSAQQLLRTALPAGAKLDAAGCTPIGAFAGRFYNVTQPSATASSGSFSFTVNFNPAIRMVPGYWNNSAAVYRGALLYGLQVGENMTTIAKYAYNSTDLTIEPTTPWNVALVVDPAAPASGTNGMSFKQLRRPTAVPYDAHAPPTSITATARILPGWQLFNNSAAPPPESPVDCAVEGCAAQTVPVTLVPFGSTHLRISAFPWIMPA